MLLADQHTADGGAEVVDEIRFVRKVDELVRVRFEQETWHAGRLALPQAVIVDLTLLGLLAPAFLEGRLVGGR